ncbi:MAG: hypothetical protein ACYDAI_03610, partial [Trichloromonadaceae bacterium]
LALDFLVETHTAGFEDGMLFFLTGSYSGPHVLKSTHRFCGRTDNISAEYAVCATYFSIVFHAMSSSNRKDIADKYGDLQETAIEYALLLASQGRDPETAGKVTMARMKISNQEMQKEARYNNANISILIEKYQNKCIEAISNPESMVK